MQFTTDNFQHVEVGAQGIGGRYFVDMMPYLDTAPFGDLHLECCRGLAKSRPAFTLGRFSGQLPPSLRETEFAGVEIEPEIIRQIEKYDPSGVHRQAMADMDRTERRLYLYFALGGLSPWYATLYLRQNSFADKTQRNAGEAAWTPSARHFPKLTAYIESLEGRVFREVGRVLFFLSHQGVAIPVHRDGPPIPHRDHCINFYFERGRPAYIWDECRNQRHYIGNDILAYFFNNRDYHGVDAEPWFRYTLRVDGTFTEEVCARLGLIDGWVSQD